MEIGGLRNSDSSYPGKRPSVGEICNHDRVISKRLQRWSQDRGSADEAIVVVKLEADNEGGDIFRGENFQKGSLF